MTTPAGVSPGRLQDQLIKAAWANDVRRARRLIEAGADVNDKDDTEQSAYLIAASEGYLDLLDLTLRNGADPGSLDGFRGTGLIRAAERGHADIVGRLLQAGIDVDHVNDLGWTALHEAIILGDGSQRYVDTVRLLVAGGADLELPSRRDGVAPIEHARSRGQQAVSAALRAGLGARIAADPDAALLRAAATGDADRAAVALRAGADLETRDARRRTPLLVAVTRDRLAVARLLVALGADADALDDRHDTPWLVTGVTGSVPMLETLLPADPDLTIRNRFGGAVGDPGERARSRRLRSPRRPDRHRRQPRQRPGLDGAARGRDPRRRLPPVPADRARSSSTPAPTPPIADKNGVTALQHARSTGQVGVARVLEGG